jgi:L-aminopeptidase/D-esterase-like protein
MQTRRHDGPRWHRSSGASAHTPFDGDTVFALASGGAPLAHSRPRAVEVARIGSAAADCMTRAIARAIHHAL